MKPRLGFLGLGWIGRWRLEDLVKEDLARPAAYLEPDAGNLEAARKIHDAPAVEDLEGMRDMGLDGVVIATPNALHADQARTFLESGTSVFCQKPLAIHHATAHHVVQSAADEDVLLAVDWSYRGTRSLQAVRKAIQQGQIGRCYQADLVFHNAYGPDKPWYHNRRVAGGGCMLDLGCHLADALHWMLPGERFHTQRSRLYREGRPIRGDDLEEHAVVDLQSEHVHARLDCSWNGPAGVDADVRLVFTGDRGAVRFRNVDGSFYDFKAELLRGTSTEELEAPPDTWGHRELAGWVGALGAGRRGFDPSAWAAVENARIVEEAYARAS